MDDLISRQAAYNALMTEPLKWDDLSVWESARCHQWTMDVDVIEALPPAQLKIIRCKDCKYCDRGIDENGNPFLKCSGWVYGGTQEEDFCSHAERRTNE